jgi:hypothetical protein
MITSWFVRIAFLVVLLLLALITTFSPVLVAHALSTAPWVRSDFDDLLEPRVRQKRKLLQEKPKEYAECYPDELAPIRIGGFVAWLGSLFLLYSLLQDMHVFW